MRAQAVLDAIAAGAAASNPVTGAIKAGLDALVATDMQADIDRLFAGIDDLEDVLSNVDKAQELLLELLKLTSNRVSKLENKFSKGPGDPGVDIQGNTIIFRGPPRSRGSR